MFRRFYLWLFGCVEENVNQHIPEFVGGPWCGSLWTKGHEHVYWVTPSSPEKYEHKSGEVGALYLYDGRNVVFARWIGREERVGDVVVGPECGGKR